MSGIPYCPHQPISASKQDQWPNHLWTSTTYSNSNCTGSAAYYAYGLNGTSWNLGGFCTTTIVSTHTYAGYTSFGSVRFRFGFRIALSTPPYCPEQYISASKQWQYPYYIWTSTPYTDTTYCTDGGKAYVLYNLNGTSWVQNRFCAVTHVDGTSHFGSVRCGFRNLHIAGMLIKRASLF